MDGIVFAVDGQEGLALAPGLRSNEFARGNQTLFVRKSNCLAGAHGLVGGFESGYAHDRADYEVCFGVSGDLHGSSRAMHDCDSSYASFSQPGAQDFPILFVGNRDQPWLPSLSLLERGIDIPASSQSNNF